jgi:hypothetical protein
MRNCQKKKLHWLNCNFENNYDNKRETENLAFNSLYLQVKIRQMLKDSIVDGEIIINKRHLNIHKEEMRLKKNDYTDKEISIILSEKYNVSTVEIDRILKLITVLSYYANYMQQYA